MFMSFMDNKIINDDLKNISGNIHWIKLKNKSIFITGAYGMLASYFVYELIYLNEIFNANITIITAVRNEEKLKNRFGEFVDKDYFEIYSKDINELIDYEENVDFIVHAASLASPQFYSTVPVDVLKPNSIGTYNLLEFAKEKQVKGFLFFSTGDVYGVVKNKKYLVESDCGLIDTLDIHSCYGESKRMGEVMCKAWNHQFNVPTRIVRIFHTYSPTMDVYNDPRVFASFTKDILNNNDIQMKSEGLAKRSFCYISDATVAFFKILLEGEDAEAYNVCNTNQFISILELAEIMVSIFPEKGLQVKKVKRDKNDSYLENKINNEIIPCNEKLKNLGWTPKVTCKEGFKRVILSQIT